MYRAIIISVFNALLAHNSVGYAYVPPVVCAHQSISLDNISAFRPIATVCARSVQGQKRRLRLVPSSHNSLTSSAPSLLNAAKSFTEVMSSGSVAIQQASTIIDSSFSLNNLTNLINEAYKIGELGIFVDTAENPFLRMTEEDVKELVQKDKLLVLTDNDNADDSSNAIIGCIKVDVVQNCGDNNEIKIGEWGCLAVRPACQGLGYGNMLIKAAEKYFRECTHDKGIGGACTHAQLELLSPSHWKHDHKERLRNWYTKRLGYKLKDASGDYDKSTVRVKKGELLLGKFELGTDSDFTQYWKAL